MIKKEEIMNDINFRKKCRLYGGVNWDKFIICDNYGNGSITIVLDTPDKDVYVFMNEDYDTIGIHRFDKYEENRSFDNIAYDFNSIYDGVSLFYNLKISDIVKIANRVNVSSTNHGHSLRMIVNGEMVDTKYGEIYIELLSYIKFLGIKIEDYYKELYKAVMLGFDYPSITTYLMSIIRNIDNRIKQGINNNERPWSVDILASIGENYDEIEYYDNVLCGLIKLLLYEKGYRIGRDSDYLKLEQIDGKTNNLYDQTEDLLKILSVSKEEVQERLANAQNNFHFNEVNLDEYLSGYCKKMR